MARPYACACVCACVLVYVHVWSLDPRGCPAVADCGERDRGLAVGAAFLLMGLSYEAIGCSSSSLVASLALESRVCLWWKQAGELLERQWLLSRTLSL